MSARTALFAALYLCAATAASSEPNLGIQAGGYGFGSLKPQSDQTLAFGEGWLDVAITDVHGLQLGLSLEDTKSGVIGTFDGHLYMAPQDTAKYGLFLVVTDLNDAHFTLAAAGAEAMISLSNKTTLDMHAGIGIAKRTSAPESLDFIFLGGGLTHEIGSELTIGMNFDVAEYDETALRAYGYTAMAQAEYSPNGGPIALTAGLGVSGLEGRNGAPAETVLKLGLSYSFGETKGTNRPFRRANPYGPLSLRANF